MHVDRPFREKLIAKTLQFIRREIRADAFNECLMDGDWSETKDRAASDVLWLLKRQADDYRDHEFCANEECWKFVTRLLAFLKTDYGLRRERTANWRVMSWWPRWLLLGLLAATGVSWWLGNWWILVGAWAVIFAVWRASFPLDIRAGKQIQKEWPFWPFLSAKDWEKHRHLVDELNLPEFDPEIYDRSIRPPAAETRMKIWSELGGVLMLPLDLLMDASVSEREIHLRTDVPLSAVAPPEHEPSVTGTR